jgi:hypothetical protein
MMRIIRDLARDVLARCFSSKARHGTRKSRPRLISAIFHRSSRAPRWLSLVEQPKRQKRRLGTPRNREAKAAGSKASMRSLKVPPGAPQCQVFLCKAEGAAIKVSHCQTKKSDCRTIHRPNLKDLVLHITYDRRIGDQDQYVKELVPC